MSNYLCTIKEPLSVVTAIDNAARFPESLAAFNVKYDEAITLFIKMIQEAADSGDLLYKIRNSGLSEKKRIALLKMFRRCVSTVLDTEAARRTEKSKPTKSFVDHFGHTFKPIADLREQFTSLTSDQRAALAALVGEYDTRGRSGYDLTEMFFQWFETAFDGVFILDGPRRAGRDVEVRTLFSDFKHDCPCDFVVRDAKDKSVLAIGFARYDSTRGGAQSDDRTGGNADKLSKLEKFCADSGTKLRLFYLADGPGLAHRDTWKAACDLDGQWGGNVRVTTFKLAPDRISEAWLRGAHAGNELDLRDALDLVAKATE
jgi:hypothetical protein